MSLLRETPEMRLLLACCGRSGDDFLASRIGELVNAGLDWDRAVDLAVRTRVTGPFYSRLRTLRRSEVPDRVMDRLRKICMLVAANNLQLDRTLASIVHALASGGVQVMLLKWAALTHMPDFEYSPRVIMDIDVLIGERDFMRARAALVEVGYHVSRPLPDLTDDELVLYAHSFDQIKFVKERGMVIDTHFRLLNMGVPSRDENAVWSRGVPIAIGDSTALVPSPEDLLLHLCFHANHHGLTRIYQLCEIIRVYDRFAGQMDWDYLAGVVRRRRMGASFYGTLKFAFELLETPFPGGSLEVFKPSYARRKMFEYAWGERAVSWRNRVVPMSLEGPFYYILEMDDLSDKLKFIGRSLFPPTQWVSRSHSRSGSSRLRIIHLSNLIGRCLRFRRIEQGGR